MGRPDRDPVSETKIMAVVVLYKQLPGDSITVRTLQAAAQIIYPSPLHLSVEIVDNTPGAREPDMVPQGMSYRAASHNPGLAEAYNTANDNAKRTGCEWLLTLDQDTALPSTFLTVLFNSIQKYRGDSTVAAIVPHIVDNGRPVSPFNFVGGFIPKLIPAEFSGIALPFASALNSAALIRVSALEEIGGYDPRFPLNNSDTSLFHRLGQAGRRIAVMENLTVHHQLAIMDRRNRMSIDRYRKILSDERAFWDMHMGFLGRVERMVRLVGRIAKDLLRGGNGKFVAATMDEVRYRLVTPKRKRIETWKRTATSV